MKFWRDFLGQPIEAGSFIVQTYRQGRRNELAVGYIHNTYDNYIIAQMAYPSGEQWRLRPRLSKLHRADAIVVLPMIPNHIFGVFQNGLKRQ